MDFVLPSLCSVETQAGVDQRSLIKCWILWKILPVEYAASEYCKKFKEALPMLKKTF